MMEQKNEGGGPKVLSPKEFAAKLGRSPKTVRQWLRGGQIRGARVGENGHWLIPAGELQRLRGETGE